MTDQKLKYLAWKCDLCKRENLVKDSLIKKSSFSDYKCKCGNVVRYRAVKRYFVSKNSCPSCNSLNVKLRWVEPENYPEFQAGLCLECLVEWNECAR